MTVLIYARQVIVATAIQFLVLLGPLLVLALLMGLVSVGVERLSIAVMGTRWYLRLFAWLGVPVHELGHALFCVLFRHRIDEIRLFRPDPIRGTLGYVNHSYTAGNVYQQVGNFFIGMGPILLGSAVLYLGALIIIDVNLFHAVQPAALAAGGLASFRAVGSMFVAHLSAFLDVGRGVLFSGSIPFWRGLVFAYLLLAVGGSVALSGSDIKGSAHGLVVLVVLLLVFNAMTIWAGDFLLRGILSAGRVFSVLYFLMIASICVYIVFAAFLGIVVLIKVAIRAIRRPSRIRP